MVKLEGYEPDPESERKKKEYEEALKEAGLSSCREGLSEGAQELIEGYRKLRRESNPFLIIFP
jgi:hypothetical protein